MIQFKSLKYKHYRRARELRALIEAEEATEEEIVVFALELVADWDFVDAETGEQLAVGTNIIDELSIEQLSEVLEVFTEKFRKPAIVPKASGGPSLSTSTQ